MSYSNRIIQSTGTVLVSAYSVPRAVPEHYIRRRKPSVSHFLGLIFDSKLTWNAHIAYIEEKCRKRLNLMRMVSGQSFGCCKTTLLTIYKALIRSVLDYGAIAFDSTSTANKHKLDVIQRKALKIACGAFCTTSAAALQVETGEMPLDCRRQQQQLNYTIKIKAKQHHRLRLS